MKLQVTQENLNKALNSVSRVASTRATLPVLANVLIKTSNNLLTISATNLNIAITHSIGAKVSTEGSITVPARLMQDFISSLPSGIINLELDGTKLKINTDKYTSSINGIISDDYPVMPSIESKKSITIAANKLKEALSQVIFTASSDETRPILTGVLLITSNSKLYIASTDSYRLAEKEITKQNQDIKILVPASSMHELLRLLPDSSELIEIIYDENQVKFVLGEIELLTRLLSGNYPDYKKLIPEKFKTTAKLKRTDMLNIVKVSSLFAKENAGSVKIEVNSADQSLFIRSIASQVGENSASADAVANGDGEITLNSRYILDALNVFSGEEIEFSFNEKLEPTMLSDPNQKDYIHIIMPLKS